MEQKIREEIIDQVGHMLDDYDEELDKGYMAAPDKFKISFGVTISPEREAGKTKVVTKIGFATEAKPKSPETVSDKMEVIV